jgi:hypothetical protein
MKRRGRDVGTRKGEKSKARNGPLAARADLRVRIGTLSRPSVAATTPPQRFDLSPFRRFASPRLDSAPLQDVLLPSSRSRRLQLPLDQMTIADKLDVMETLWADLARRPADLPSPAWHREVLLERRSLVEEGKLKFEPSNSQPGRFVPHRKGSPAISRTGSGHLCKPPGGAMIRWKRRDRPVGTEPRFCER